ncbi:RsmE family RNA methyltransferase [Microvenator marinus]|uniref:RsmE family RNA methyltransferase n=1 Tax=Microvenator marinus TaxID=2600177 RepID=UPI00201B592D|nr:RsmE family RNA methyltransferase [Microvenator marinus]
MSRTRRVWVDDLKLGEVGLSTEERHYLEQVLRVADGTVVEVFDGQGKVGKAKLNLGSNTMQVSELEARVDSGPEIRLYQAIPKGDRWEWTIEKATELGVTAIYPILTERTVVQVPPGKLAVKLERWQKIATAAARQSHAALTPSVEAPIQLKDALLSEGRKYFGDFEGESASDFELGDSDAPIELFVGPEGGFSAAELHLLNANATGIYLGPQVLRAETAAIAFITWAQLKTGW